MATTTPKMSLILDKRYAKKDDVYPVKLRITFKRESKYYPTGHDMTEQEFVRQRDCELLRANKYIGTKEYAQLSQVNKKLEAHLANAQQAIGQMKVFNFDLYEEKRSNGQASVDDIYSAFLAKIASLEAEERIGTAITYQCALKSLQNFYSKSKLPLESITIKFLQTYERWMLENGNSLTTVGFYLRNLRAIMNSMLDNNKQKMDEYPFGPRKYIIPTKKNSKRALSNEDLKKLVGYQPDEQEEKYLSFWLFMYLANGMNPTNMVRLKYKDLRSDRIVFLREKTKRTNRESTLIEVHLNPVLKEIIEKWGNYPDPDNYIFPVLNDVTSAARAKKIITQFVKQINKYMRRIGKKLEIDKQITTYVARHSFVTKLISEGGTLMEVKSMTGHKSITTTEGYVGSIEDERLRKITSRLLNF